MSCSHDPHDENQDPSNTDVHEWEDSTLSGDAVMGSAMTFKVGGGMSVERTAQTRATTDINGTATFNTGDLVVVAVTRSGGSEVVKLYQVKSDGSLEYAGGDNDPFVWKSTTEQVTIRAWSYGTSTNLSYTLTAPETQDYSLETDQQTNGYRELLYCKAANKNYSGGTISLNFYHQLARAIFYVKHEKSGILTIDNVLVGGSTFPTKARFNVPDGDSDIGTWITKGYGSVKPKTENTQPGSQATFSAVIFPTINYVQDTKLFTVTNSDGDYVYSVSDEAGLTLSAGNQYNYFIEVLDDALYLRNPLWYMGKYNVKRINTSVSWTSTTNSDWTFDTTAGHTQGEFFQWSSVEDNSTYDGCVRTFGSGIPTDGYYAPRTSPITISEDGTDYNWHLGTLMEWLTIFPVPPGDPNLTIRSNTWAGEKGTEPECTFGYGDISKYKDGDSSDKTQGNAYISYWTSMLTPSYGFCRYAVRFIGTRFCSAWRYQYFCNSHNASSNAYIVVSSHLLNQNDVNSDAKLLSYFTAGNTNCLEEKSESYWTENLADGIVQRSLYACGFPPRGLQGGTSGDVGSSRGQRGIYWSTTEANKTGAWGIGIASNGTSGHSKLYPFSIRLFRDH